MIELFFLSGEAAMLCTSLSGVQSEGTEIWHRLCRSLMTWPSCAAASPANASAATRTKPLVTCPPYLSTLLIPLLVTGRDSEYGIRNRARRKSARFAGHVRRPASHPREHLVGHRCLRAALLLHFFEPRPRLIHLRLLLRVGAARAAHLHHRKHRDAVHRSHFVLDLSHAGVAASHCRPRHALGILLVESVRCIDAGHIGSKPDV